MRLFLLFASAFAVFAFTGAAYASPRMDRDMQRVLDAQADLKPKPIEQLAAEEARQQPSPADGMRAVMKKMRKNPDSAMGVATEPITIDGAAGPIAATLYTPKGGARGKMPVVVYYHGGGWVLATNATYDATPRAMAKAANAIFVSVEYRKAPEAKFPAAHDDAVAAYQWVLEHAGSFGGDARRVAVMGESAGGNLAINTAIAARDRGLPMPVHQVLVYPVAGISMNTPSYQDHVAAKPLNKPMMAWFMRQATDGASDLEDPRLDLLGQADLKGLPPSTVITAEIDPLRSEGEMLAAKLRAAGVRVHARTFQGVTHEFFGMAAVVEDAKRAQAMAAKDLRMAFGGVAMRAADTAPQRR